MIAATRPTDRPWGLNDGLTRSAPLLFALFSAAACAPEFTVEEATIAEIHAAMENGRLTSEALVRAYLDRIDAYDKQGPSINSLITISDVALERARELDATFATSGFVGPLHASP